MKTRYLVALALFIIAILALVAFWVSYYVQPSLPANTNSILLLWVTALTGAASFLSVFKDVIELVEKLTQGRKGKQRSVVQDKVVQIRPASSQSVTEGRQQAQPIKASTFVVICNMRTKRQHHLSVKLSNGDVLITGGFDYDGNPPQEVLASAEYYSAQSMSVSSHGRMVARRYFAAATLLPNNAVLITGGVGENGETLDSAELYNPSTRTFTTIGSMTTKRHGHSAIALRNGKVLILGGAGGENNQTGSRLPSAEIFDPLNNSFTPTGNMSVGRLTEHVPNALSLSDGRVLVAGGYGPEGQLASVEIYDPGKGNFISCGNMAVKRACHTLTQLPNGKVLITGGHEDSAGHLATAEIFDLETGTSFLTEVMKVAHCLHTATLLPNEHDKVMIIGGASPLVELYDPNTNAFSVYGELNSSRYLHTTALLPTGQILVIGGADTRGNSLASIERSDATYH